MPKAERLTWEEAAAPSLVVSVSGLKADPSQLLYQPNYRGVEIAP